MTRSICIGIDGCPYGWVGATRERVVVDSSLAGLLEALDFVAERDIAAIDIPIGLADSGRRRCDEQARRCLGRPRQNSVFWTATRAAVYTESHASATCINRQNQALGVSAQAFRLFPRIREVDRYLASDTMRAERIIEVHPELAFARWHTDEPNRLAPMPYAKKSGLGAFDRLALVFQRYGREAIERVRARYTTSQLADDDIADAYACLFSAERIAANRHMTLPAEPPRDTTGLPMRICF